MTVDKAMKKLEKQHPRHSICIDTIEWSHAPTPELKAKRVRAVRYRIFMTSPGQRDGGIVAEENTLSKAVKSINELKEEK